MSRQNTFLVIWATVAVVIALSGKYDGIPACGIQATIGVQMLVFLLFITGSAVFREHLLSLNLAHLTMFHVWRILPGATFLYFHYKLGLLPWSFAVPGGYGDIAVGITAVFASKLVKTGHPQVLLAWQMLALLDLLNVIRAGLVNGINQPASMMPLTHLPLNLLPLMMVPLTLMAHVAAIYILIRKKL